ncbi:unnamed protein product [Ectocarpus sp. 6 AP-2014]
MCPDNSPALYPTGTIQSIENACEIQCVPAENTDYYIGHLRHSNNTVQPALDRDLYCYMQSRVHQRLETPAATSLRQFGALGGCSRGFKDRCSLGFADHVLALPTPVSTSLLICSAEPTSRIRHTVLWISKL